MAITYEEALKAQREIEDKLLLDPNIVSIGVVEELNRQGQKYGNFIVEVGVISFEIYQHALAHGKSVIPNEFTFRTDNGNQEIKHVQIKVVKTGPINALYSSNTTAVDNIPPSYPQSERGSMRPVGFLLAGNVSESFHNRIKAVFSSPSIPWRNRYSSGNSHTFAKDQSLRIARRHYSSLPSSSYYHLTKSSFIIHNNMVPNLLLRRRSIFLAFGIFSLKSTIDFTESKTLQLDIPAINNKRFSVYI